jgi:hypothetical protein
MFGMISGLFAHKNTENEKTKEDTRKTPKENIKKLKQEVETEPVSGKRERRIIKGVKSENPCDSGFITYSNFARVNYGQADVITTNDVSLFGNNMEEYYHYR